MMLVSGYAGIGKSALVQELYKPLTAKRGYFIWGKFDQFGRNILQRDWMPWKKFAATTVGAAVTGLLLTALSNGQIIIDHLKLS